MTFPRTGRSGLYVWWSVDKDEILFELDPTDTQTKERYSYPDGDLLAQDQIPDNFNNRWDADDDGNLYYHEGFSVRKRDAVTLEDLGEIGTTINGFGGFWKDVAYSRYDHHVYLLADGRSSIDKGPELRRYDAATTPIPATVPTEERNDGETVAHVGEAATGVYELDAGWGLAAFGEYIYGAVRLKDGSGNQAWVYHIPSDTLELGHKFESSLARVQGVFVDGSAVYHNYSTADVSDTWYQLYTLDARSDFNAPTKMTCAVLQSNGFRRFFSRGDGTGVHAQVSTSRSPEGAGAVYEIWEWGGGTPWTVGAVGLSNSPSW